MKDTIFEIQPWLLRWILNIFLFAPFSLPMLMALTITYCTLEVFRFWWTQLVWPTFTGEEPDLYESAFVNKLF